MKKGSHHSPESIARMSMNRKGKACGDDNAMSNPEIAAKSSRNHIGVKRPDMVGDNNPMRDPVIAAKCAKAVKATMNTPELKEKYSVILHRPDVVAKRIASVKRGPEHYNWKGGVSKEPYCEKWTRDLRERIRSFFDHRCVICGKTSNDNHNRLLSCHHVYFDKESCCNDLPPAFATLCCHCHTRTQHDKLRWMYMMGYIIEEVYNGKSYYTKDEYREIIGVGKTDH